MVRIDEVFVVAVIFIVLVIVIIFTIIYFIPPIQQFTSPSGTFLTPCEPSPTSGTSGCLTGNLICDNASGVCKLAEGQPCNAGSDCASGLFCSGVCVPNGSPVGGIGQYCPCQPGNVCVQEAGGTAPLVPGSSICLGGGDAPCTSDNQCASNFCASASGAITPCGPLDLDCVCRAGLPLAAACTANSDCETNNCSLGFCQLPSVITGTKGAFCAAGSSCPVYPGASCDAGLACLCSTLADGSAIGACTAIDNGLLSPCAPNSGCPTPMACTTYPASATGTNTTCLYTPSTCIDGTTGDLTKNGAATFSDPVGSCLNNTGIGCVIDNNCVSGSCNNPGTLSVYAFNNAITTNFALTQTATLLAPLPPTSPQVPAIFQPSKIFAVSQGLVDNIFLVDTNAVGGGLLVTQITITSDGSLTVTQPWTQLQPRNLSGLGTLVDAIVDQNENQYLVYNNGTNDIIYTYDGVSYQPFNGGIQYDTAMNPLTIDYIDISLQNDILIATGGLVYTKAASAMQYTNQNVLYTGGAPRFFAAPSPALAIDTFAYLQNGVVNFNSSTPIFCMDTSGAITNFNINPTTAGLFVYLSDLLGLQNNNLFAQVPGSWTGGTGPFGQALSLVTDNGYYILTPASCN